MELNKVEIKATIGGTDCYIISLHLEQNFNRHHTFECVVDYNDLDTKWMESPGKTFNLLGQDVNIEMKHRKGDGLNLFTGVITQVSYIGHHGGQNHIRVSGCSPTIKLDGSKTMDSFMDMTLSSIVAEAVSTSGNGGEVTPQPKFKGKIDYICQYDETCFEFLNRLSWIYGEWFFYDGQKCYFGKQDGAQETITFESEMTTFDLSANLLPSKMKRYHYLVHDDRETDSKASDPSVIGYHTVSQGQSSSVYTSDAILPIEAVIQNESEIEALTKAEKNRATFSMLTVSGTSQTSKVKIGGKVLVKLPANMETTKKEVDTFLVTSVVHEYDLKAEYRNSFTAIPATVESIPMTPVTLPKAFSQLATVKTNADDKQLGRVKVQTQWQKATGKTTNWIRVQTPDAGPNPKARRFKDKVPKNRGFVFIPEEDDIVMLDFEYGDPNRPYVAGSIFSEKASKGGDSDNKLKSITTRSGITIIFDDDENKGSLTLRDPSGNVAKFDGKGNITITAPNVFTVNATDIKLNATNSITAQSKPGKNGGEGTVEVIAHKTMDLKTETDNFSVESQSKAISVKAKTDFSASSETSSMKLLAAKNTKIESADIKINASSTIRIKSNDTDVI